jgi:large subunit ribosomal protein L5
MNEKEFTKNIVPKLQKELNIKNSMMVPRLVKITINCGMGEAVNDKKIMDSMSKQIMMITGQKPIMTIAKKAISSFKIREGMPIGLKVTLRKQRMYDFFTKLVSIVLPRVRDFRGLKRTSFDGTGNYTLGLSEQLIFPELDYSMIDKVRGFEIVCTTSTHDDKEAFALFSSLGMPFEKS